MSLITHITQAPQITLVGGTAPQIVTLVGVPGLPGTGLKVVGAVTDASQLPASAASGDIWVTRGDGHGHAWNGAAWVDIGPISTGATAISADAGNRAILGSDSGVFVPELVTDPLAYYILAKG